MVCGTIGAVDGFYIQGAVLLIAQIACLVHIGRTGGNWLWAIPILLFPYFGILAYFLVEVMNKSGRSAASSGMELAGPANSSVKKLRRELEISPTVENRSKLALALLERGEAEEAVEIYESCLQGVYRDDKNLWYEAAEAYHAAGRDEDALRFLDKLDQADFRDYRRRRELLRALSLKETGDIEGARELFESLIGNLPSERPRYELAKLLIERGDREAARKLLDEMFNERKFKDARYRKREARWYREAKKLM